MVEQSGFQSGFHGALGFPQNVSQGCGVWEGVWKAKDLLTLFQ